MANHCSNTLTVKTTNDSKAAKIQFNEFMEKAKNVGESVKIKDAKEFREKYINDNFEEKYRNNADLFVEHSEMAIATFMVRVCGFTREGEGKKVIFVRGKEDFTMEGLMPCPEELKKVTSPVRAENGENEEQFKERVERNKNLYGASDWYNWNCDNRGCKWDVFDSSFAMLDEKSISYYYTTAWSPNDAFVRSIAPQFPLLDFHLEFEEPGCAFAGEVEIIAGEIENDGTWDYVETCCCECGEEVGEDEKLDDEGRCPSCAEAAENEEDNM